MTTRELFLRHVAQTSPSPMSIEVESAEGIYIHAAGGKRYMDMIAGISVSNLGHCHPQVVAAIEAQLKKYMHVMVYGEYIQSPQVKLATRLNDVLPAPLESVYFTTSGSEAVEGAMKLAKRATGRTEIIAFEKSYHGSTQGALSIMGDEYFKQAFRPLLPDIKHLPYNNIEQLQHITTRTACVVVEAVQAESGVHPASKAFWQALRQRCDDTGTLLVLDEIQTAYGRTGKLFAMEHYDIVPDMLLLAKGFGGGLPHGAFIASHALMQHLTYNPVLGHINTFGGNAVCCAAGLATLDVLLNSNYIADVAVKEALFYKHLVHPAIKDIRSKGLLLAVEFESADINMRVIKKCTDKGVITDWFLFAPHCLRIAPPLIITEQEIIGACAIIVSAIDECTT